MLKLVQSNYYETKKIIISNAFEKKQDKLPVNEKRRSLQCKISYENRVKRGVYYV